MDGFLFNKRIQSVGFFGLGESNLGVLRFLSKMLPGVKKVLRSDTWTETFLNFDCTYFGNDATMNITEDILFLSPSVRRDRVELQEAASRGVILSSDAELYFSLCNRDIIGITGSDGKSTTTHLIASMLCCDGINASPAGNFGESLLDFSDGSKTPVAELSSFQLMNFTPRLKVAVITNIVPNHLNWHKSFDEYASAKIRILENAERTVYDADSGELYSRIKGKQSFAAISSELQHKELSSKVDSLHYITLFGDDILLDNEKYVTLKDAKRREAYNVKNYMLAIGATLGIVSQRAQTIAINSFCGLPHRMETIYKTEKYKYIDSSIDSTLWRTIATLSALEGASAVIISGKNKGLSLTTLADNLPKLTSGAVLMGEIGETLYPMLKEKHLDFPVEIASDMDSAVFEAEKLLPNGGNIILSPAGTSFDKYKNYVERGMDFRASVLKNKNKDD